MEGAQDSSYFSQWIPLLTQESQVQQDKTQSTPRLEKEEMVNKAINSMKNKAAGPTEIVKMVWVNGPVALIMMTAVTYS